MGKLVLRRLAFGIPLLFVVTVVTFLLVAISPGDAARILAGPEAGPAEYEALRQQLGLDDPLPVQYWHWLQDALHGDLGTSIVNGSHVVQSLNDRLGVTLSLVVLATVLSTVIGILLGCLSAHRGGVLGRLVDFGAVIGSALPQFWLGLVIVTIFSTRLHLFPAVGYVDPGESPVQWLRFLALPVLTLVVGGLAGIAKQTRDAMLTGLSAEYAVAHRADGVPERVIVYRHVLRNSAPPVIAVVGIHFVGALSGSVLVEQIFGLPGLGSLAVTATTQSDIPVIQGIALYFGIMVVLVNLGLDLVYRKINPKVDVS
ncbi:ABC transporter permease [Amycolatopsis endophytica]|uniref:Peptide/nickel transport system permease protein n=1 Tax=Amycolatopsis endophytica TaxID=860233 RepID=A0A853B983_9PSEU|nr:ABC transporter permease [Amycolatopsis endophytica]NYI91699.1 peptide/nickel transport system permease protein [Amycolatopsis endophytica]